MGRTPRVGIRGACGVASHPSVAPLAMSMVKGGGSHRKGPQKAGHPQPPYVGGGDLLGGGSVAECPKNVP